MGVNRILNNNVVVAAKVYTTFTGRVAGRYVPMVRVTCSSCGAKASVKMKKTTPTAQVSKMLARRGWVVDHRGRSAECPDCVSAGKRSTPTSK